MLSLFLCGWARSGVAVVKLTLLGLLLIAIVAVPGWYLVEASRSDGGDHRHSTVVRTYMAEDSSGYGNHGVIQGDPAMGIPGHTGTAYSFLRGRSWVQVPSSATLNPGTRDFLVSAWVLFQDVPGVDETYDIVRKGVSYTREGEFKLEIVDPGDVRCTVKDSARHEARATTQGIDVSDGKWHYVGCGRVGASLVVVADDAVTVADSDLRWIGNTMPLAIGSKYGWEDQSNGRVDEVRVVVSPDADDPDAQVDPVKGLRRLEAQAPAGSWELDESEYAR